MPRNGSGVYSLPAGNPVVTGTTITSTWGNSTASDIGTEITNSLDRSGRGGMLAALKGIQGTVGAPAYSFTVEPTTGLFLPATNDVQMAVGGNIVMKWWPNGIVIAPLGSVSNPSITWIGSTSGIYVDGGGIRFAFGGVTGMTANAAGLYSSGLLYGRGGGAGLGQITVSTLGPSGGADGDLWFQY